MNELGGGLHKSQWVVDIMGGTPYSEQVGGEQNAGWRISSWVKIIKLGGDNQAGWS